LYFSNVVVVDNIPIFYSLVFAKVVLVYPAYLVHTQGCITAVVIPPYHNKDLARNCNISMVARLPIEVDIFITMILLSIMRGLVP